MAQNDHHDTASSWTDSVQTAQEPAVMPAATGTDGVVEMISRGSLRLAATLLFGGVLLSVLAGILHPAQENPNDHNAAFAEYAASGHWTAVHLGQFVGMAVLVAGLLVLSSALGARRGAAGWLNRFGAVAAAVALALYGALQAVDGVALKQAVDAWAGAPDGEKAARFATAEAVRWLEWGVRSYQSFVLGLAFILLGTTIVMTGRVSRAIGALLGLSGLAYLAQGWVVGSGGFASANTAPTLLGIVLTLAWSAWLMVAAWRSGELVDSPAS